MTILETGHSGTVNKWFPDRGYGFIYDEQLKKTVFFHITGWMNEGEPARGDYCIFDIAEGKQDHKAVNIQREEGVTQ